LPQHDNDKKMLRICTIIFGLCLALNLSKPAFSQQLDGKILSENDCSSNAFLIPSIMIDSEGVTGTEARDIGIKQATIDAFDKLVRRMAIPEQDAISSLDREAVERFVDFIRISSENALPRRYIAEIDICFDPVRVRAGFIEAGLAWSELLSPPILLLPVWEEPAGVRVWARNITWLDGWHQFKTDDNSLVRFTLLRPSLEIERQLSARAIASAQTDILARAAQAADALQIVWVYAGLDYQGAVPELVLSARLYDNEGAELARLIERREKLDGKLNLQNAFASIRQEITSIVALRWQQANLYHLGTQNEILITVNVSNMNSWINTRRVLKAQASIDSFTPIKLSKGEAVLKARLSAPVESLLLSIKSLGFVLEPSERGYILRTDIGQ